MKTNPSLTDVVGLEAVSTRAAKKSRPRDPNLDCKAVILYRDVVHLSLNHIQRAYVAETVECTPRGLAIWEAVLIEHLANGRNPKAVPSMLKIWQGMYYV